MDLEIENEHDPLHGTFGCEPALEFIDFHGHSCGLG
jgi:hypothetical protein